MNLSATSISLSSTVVLVRVTCCALHDGFACCLWQVPHGIDGYENAAAALSAEAAGVGKAANAISASHLRGTNSEEGLQGNADAPSVLDMPEALSKISQGCFSREAASNSVCRSLDEFFTSLLLSGVENAEISARLNISQRTVENHRANLYHKLEVRNADELLRLGESACGSEGRRRRFQG